VINGVNFFVLDFFTNTSLTFIVQSRESEYVPNVLLAAMF
jgi:hypothetical protein